MAVTAWKSPGTISSQTRTGGSVTWNNPANVSSSDNVYATAALVSNASHWLWCTNFGFTTSDIPTGSTITGYEVEWERKRNLAGATSGVTDTYYKPIVGGAEAGTQKQLSQDPSTLDSSAGAGGAGDTWSASFSETDARASDTGIAISHHDTLHSAGVTISADNVRIRWYYDPPPTSAANFFLLF